MRKRCLSVIAAMAVLLADSSPGRAAAVPAFRVRYRTAASANQSCGPDSLYLVTAVQSAPHSSLHELENALAVGPDGCSLKDLWKTARSVGLDADLVHAPLAALLQLSDTAILHVNGNHFVVLFGQEEGRLVLFDNAVGVIDCAPEWFSRAYLYEGNALVFRADRPTLFASVNRAGIFWSGAAVIVVGLGVVCRRLTVGPGSPRARLGTAGSTRADGD